MNKLGLYFHIPFCIQKCGYCNFISGCDFSKMREYHQSILQNIILYSTQFENHVVDSVYFGGGTPSAYFKGGLGSVLDSIRGNFNVASECEITAEANPETLTAQKAAEWAASGINRISIGLQSAENTLLKAIGRRHTAGDFFKAYENAVAAGITNISADIMLGLPGQSVSDIENTVKVLYKLPFLRHLSAYALKLEKETPFYARYCADKSATEECACGLPDDDEAADMYDAAYTLLEKSAYRRYEVSNFAFPGFECRHNLKYWNLGEYLGIGVSAHSYYGGKRYAFTDDIDKFIGGETPSCAGLSDEDRRTEYIMLKLRLREGMPLDEYYKKFGTRLEKSEGAQYLLKHGMMGASDGRLYILPDKFYVMNAIILKLLS